tara:strand:- start:1357 stop:1623 length:267 start_codon:yes stop_codon:yes gene_type:complete
MDKLEKFITSVNYLPPILYFGSVGLLGYDIYSNVFKEIEFLSLYIQTPLTVIFFYMTYLGLKKYQKKIAFKTKLNLNKLFLNNGTLDF